MRLTWLVPTFCLVLACSPVGDGSSSSVGKGCSAAADCGGTSVCLPNGTCGAGCTADSQCGAGQKCSTGGGCVASTACGSDTDCSGAQVCGGGSSCTTACSAAFTCGAGETCNLHGHCSSPLPSGASPNPNVPGSCGGEPFTATPVPATFLIVLDHSGSMMQVVAGRPKWSAATAAVKDVTSQNDQKIAFGLQMFSVKATMCSAGQTNVAIGDHQAAAISGALPALADGQRTAIGAALNLANQTPGLDDPNRSNNVLLVTDGMENCGGDPVGLTQALFKKNVKTYVVGFGGEVDDGILSVMAQVGGTSRTGPVKYYQADDGPSLQAALNAITRAGLGCDLKLNQVPADPSKLFVYVNGSEQKRDPSKQNGWQYFPATNRVTLYGAACGLVANDPNGSAKVSFVYGCADGTLVDGAPGSACGANEHCASGKCTAGRCEAPAGQKPGGTVCGSNPECASTRCTNGRCESGGGVVGGSACGANSECASGTCTSGYCAAPAGAKPNGSPCSSGASCASGSCVSGLCEGGSKPGGAPCTTGLECTSTRCTLGRCELPSGGAAGGSACAVNTDCASGTCSGGLCEAPASASAAGAPCSSNSACKTLQCSSGVCGAGKAGGSACSTNSECFAGRCTSGLCESGKPDGSSCSSPNECVSKQCVNNVCTAIIG